MANDILLDETGDLAIKNGDFVVDYSDDQHIELIMTSRQGDIKDFPLLGLGIQNYLQSPLSPTIKQRMKRDLRLQLESDSAKDISISWEADDIKVQARYE